MDDKKTLDLEVEHLCGICQYTHKCIRFKGITEAVQKIEENALDKWRVDTELTYAIKKCDLFLVDEQKVEKMIEEILVEIENEENNYGFRNRLDDYGIGEDY